MLGGMDSGDEASLATCWSLPKLGVVLQKLDINLTNLCIVQIMLLCFMMLGMGLGALNVLGKNSTPEAHP